MTISKDRVKPSPLPDSWKLSEIFTTGIVLGSYLALMTVIFFYIVVETNFFPVSIFFPVVVHYFVILSFNEMIMKYSAPGPFWCETLSLQSRCFYQRSNQKNVGICCLSSSQYN